jgi:hypothetical protein
MTGDRPAIIWEESTPAGPRIQLRLAGRELSPPQTLSGPGGAAYPSVTVAEGRLVSAWTVTAGDRSEIHVRRLDSAWSR